MIAEILCVGTELLMGQILNTNARFLSRQLAALGISQYHQTVVGDNAERLEDAYRLALSRADVVITSGGLGPTADDITKRAAARVLGRELVPFPEAEAMVRQRFREYGREMHANNLSQTLFVPGTRLILNPYGTAPGAIVPTGEGKTIIHLPGPPRELEPLFREQVSPWLASLSGRVILSRYIHIFGMGESAVDEKLRDLELGGNPSLSPYCSTGEVMLRLTASGEDAESCRALLRPVEAEVCRRLGDTVYAVEDDDEGSLAKSCAEAFRRRGLTLALLDEATGGLIASELSSAPGADEMLRAALILPRAHDTGSASAQEIRTRFGADCGLAAIAGDDETRILFSGAGRERSLSLHLTGDVYRVRTLTAKHALHLALSVIASPIRSGKH